MALPRSDPAPGDNFGNATAISTDTAIVATQQDDGGAGSAYVFVYAGGGWSQQQKLVATDGGPGDFFGVSVAIDGDTAIVGAAAEDAGADASGAAYVFVRTGSSWSQQQKITAADGGASDHLGTSVAIAGDTVVVGAPYNDEFGDDAGAAYVFVRTGGSWSQQQKLGPLDPDADHGFGSDVGISADTSIVSAPGDDEAGMTAGAAYVFTRTGSVWSQQQKLTASDAVGGEVFGTAVAISGETAMVGAHYGVASGLVTGAAYVFVRAAGVWSEQQKLTAFDGTPHDDFGWAVAISGDVALAGGDADDGASGSAHLFVRKDGVWFHKYAFEAPLPGGNFGYAGAVSNDTAIVGAISEMGGAGTAYAFAIDPILNFALPGRGIVIKNKLPEDESRNRIVIRAKDSSLWMPVPGSSTDPTVAGGSIRIESPNSGQVFTQALPAANWRLVGTASAASSYQYLDRELDDGPCKRVALRSSGSIRLSCSGTGPSMLGYDLAAGQSEPPVRVTMETGLGTDVGYCLEFGGTIVRDGTDGKIFKAKLAPAPASCE